MQYSHIFQTGILGCICVLFVSACKSDSAPTAAPTPVPSAQPSLGAQTFVVTVPPTPVVAPTLAYVGPVLTPLANQTIIGGKTLAFTVGAIVADPGNPANAVASYEVNSSTQIIPFQRQTSPNFEFLIPLNAPSQTATVIVTAIDLRGLKQSTTFQLTVNGLTTGGQAGSLGNSVGVNACESKYAGLTDAASIEAKQKCIAGVSIGTAIGGVLLDIGIGAASNALSSSATATPLR